MVTIIGLNFEIEITNDVTDNENEMFVYEHFCLSISLEMLLCLLEKN